MIERLRRIHCAYLYLFIFVATASADDLWSVHIDEGPAPPPKDGPPLSANASRNPALLKYQIPGIAGGYVGFVLVVNFFILVVGRRLRREAESSRKSLAMELVKPMAKALEASPVSPGDKGSWFGKFQNSRRSPPQKSVSSFDSHVIELDKARRQEEMEKLYAAVMASESTSPTHAMAPAYEVHPPQAPAPTHKRSASNSSRNFSRRDPLPQVYTDINASSELPMSPGEYTPRITPQSPVRAIYPPEGPMPNDPYAATDSTQLRNLAVVAGDQYYNQTYQRPQPTKTPPPQEQRSATSSPQSRRSFHNRLTTGGGSQKNKGPRSIRELQISAPIPRDPDLLDEVESIAASTPRRIYQTPPPPPLPPTHPRPDTPIGDEDEDNDDEFIHAYYGHESAKKSRTPARPTLERNISQTSNISSISAVSAVSAVSVPPYPYPEPQSQPQSQPQPQRQQYVGVGTLPARSPYQAPPRIQLPTSPQQRPQVTATNSSGSLPFRNYNHSPASPTGQLLSPPPVKTTFLSPRRDQFYGGLHSARTPRTGMATPYSPYMPFTPITPVTPHLQSKAERSRRRREAGRTVATPQDEVLHEKDMFGEAW